MKNTLTILFLLIGTTGFAHVQNKGFYGNQNTDDVCDNTAAMFDDQKVIDLGNRNVQCDGY